MSRTEVILHFPVFIGVTNTWFTDVIPLLHSSALHYRWVSITEMYFISILPMHWHDGLRKRAGWTWGTSPVGSYLTSNFKMKILRLWIRIKTWKLNIGKRIYHKETGQDYMLNVKQIADCNSRWNRSWESLLLHRGEKIRATLKAKEGKNWRWKRE